ncbi:MAG: vWA domain-containing protein [Chloroflexota bacterium]
MEFFITPLLWWLLLPPALLGAYAWAQSRRARDAVPYSSLALLRAARAGRPSTAFRRHVPPVLVALGVALAATALARPFLRVPIPRERATIILVLDVSGSMAAGDMFPSRLAAAKRASKGFVDTLPADFRVGVVAFSSEASLVQPVTDDHDAVRAAIDGLEIGGGTAIGEGLEVALAALTPEDMPPGTPSASRNPSSPGLAGAAGAGGSAGGGDPPSPVQPPVQPGQPPPAPSAVVLLLTDGENTEGVPPLDATVKARDANIPVFTVGMGSRGGGFPFGFGGRRGGGGIDEPLLQEMAAQTGGQYYYAPNGGELGRIYNDLGIALGWDFERWEIGHYVGAAALAASALGLCLAFLWLHRQP